MLIFLDFYQANFINYIIYFILINIKINIFQIGRRI